MSGTQPPDADGFVPVGTPIDLDNCAREPIHIPGSIQPRGVLAVVGEPGFDVRHVSANVVDLLGRDVEEVLGQHLSALIGADQAALVQQTAAAFGNLRQRNPLECSIDVGGQRRAFDVILHREPGGTLLVEIEKAFGERPFSFPNTYQAVRDWLEKLNEANALSDLYDVAARAVRDLTGFDRVMVYRYDRDYNGEVVAEAKREDLNSFLGLHYPASDIPAQARQLYEKNWLRLISDVSYRPSPVLPATGDPVDLTHATLRSVSPIHLEYLQNMGVQASMSISLLRRGRLWGLIACHHYSGPHLPPYGSRAAAEFLGSTLSLRLVDQADSDELRKHLASQAVLSKLTAATLSHDQPLAETLLAGPDPLDLLPAHGVAVMIAGEYRAIGTVPPATQVRDIAHWARQFGSDIVTSECLAEDAPSSTISAELAAGVLALTLPDEQYVIWFRREAVQVVDWGGDPHNKAIAVAEGDQVRLSPRKSFERWRELVSGRCEPWAPMDTESAHALRRHLVELLFRRARDELRIAEALQRSLLPQSIPTPPGWQLSAHYEPAAGGRVGGDWYDAFELRDGRLVVLLGDVAGHGVGAAGMMAQLRNVLRAQLFAGNSPAEAFTELNGFCIHLVRRAFATIIAARIDLSSGLTELASAGHLMPFVIDPTAGPTPVQIPLSPPIGIRTGVYTQTTMTLQPGQGLVLFSDGVVEHRDSTIDEGIDRLAHTLGTVAETSALSIWAALAADDTDDDITIVTVQRRHVSR